MRAYQKPLIIILIFLLAGCATGSSIVTGTVRPAISADMVKYISTHQHNMKRLALSGLLVT